MKDLSQPQSVHPLTPISKAGDSAQGPNQKSAAPNITETEIIDWDVKIEDPPVRASRNVTAVFVADGKRLPILPDEPWD